MATKTITAQAIIKAQDHTAGVFASIAGRARAMMRSLAATSGGIGSAHAVRARANEAAQRAGEISARNRARADAVLAARGGADGLALRFLAPAAVAAAGGKSVLNFADAERSLTRIGITAGATREELASTMQSAQKLAFDTAQPFQKIVEGMETLAAQGRTMKEVQEFIPAVARTAQAAGAEVSDIAKTADAVGSHLGITSKEMQTAFDIMAEGGKRGSFELKDMARYLPSLLPAAKALGVEGTKGLADIVALMQMVRKSSGTSEEAAASMSDIMQKMEIEETTKKFKKFGVDSTAAFAKARKEGRNVFDVLEELLQKATKGDLSKLPQLFGDKEALRFARSIMQDAGRWRSEAADMRRTAPGTIGRDIKPVIDSTRGRIDQLSTSFDNASRALDAFIAIPATPALQALAEYLERAAKGWDLLNEGIKKRHDQNKDTTFPESVDPPWVQEWERRFGIAPRIPDAVNVMRGMARRYAEEQKKANEFSGGASYRGTAFGFGQGGISRTAYGGHIVGGYDANVPLPPARPREASSSEDIGRAITGGPRLGKLEAVVNAPVTAQLSGSAEVSGSARLDVAFTLNDSGIVRRLESVEAKLNGVITAVRNNGGTGGSHRGRGGTGVSSPDTGMPY